MKKKKSSHIWLYEQQEIFNYFGTQVAQFENMQMQSVNSYSFESELLLFGCPNGMQKMTEQERRQKEENSSLMPQISDSNLVHFLHSFKNIFSKSSNIHHKLCFKEHPVRSAKVRKWKKCKQSRKFQFYKPFLHLLISWRNHFIAVFYMGFKS